MTFRHPIRIVLADDHPLVVEGIAACLNSVSHTEIVGVANDGQQAFRLVQETEPDVVMLDINMPKLNGLDTIELLREQLPETKILILSMHDNREYISTALRYGASGYVLKEVSTKEIVMAIEAIHCGGTYFSSGVSDVFSENPNDTHDEQLTTREQTVLTQLAEGFSNKEIASQLDISVRTVETHRLNIKRKLGINSTAGLVRYAIDNVIVSSSSH